MAKVKELRLQVALLEAKCRHLKRRFKIELECLRQKNQNELQALREGHDLEIRELQQRHAEKIRYREEQIRLLRERCNLG
eukprot:m51a1_g1589 hypothetical protein (80) ;mRNA; f:145606-146012